MAIILTILITLFFAFVIGMLVYLFIEIRWLGLSIYFMKFRIEGHPMLIMMVEDVLERLGKEENVPVFYKTYEELNKNETNEKEKAVGMYVHSASAEHQKKCDDALQEIRQMERDWRKPYNEICRLVGVESRLIEDDFVLPKILLCREMTMKYGGLLSLYATHFHEFGHHFAIKQCGDRSEEAADKYGYKLIEENLPYFFKLFPYINYTHRLKTAELTIRETLRAYWQYWQYLRIKNKK